MIWRLTLVALAATVLNAPVHAACFQRDPAAPGGWNFGVSGPVRTFPIDDEFGRAFLVASVRVSGATPKLDADGLYAHAYRVEPIQTFKGPTLTEFTVYNPNTTARFDMEAGKTYLLFLQASGGRSVVDNCGWSDDLAFAADTLAKVQSLSTAARSPSSP